MEVHANSGFFYTKSAVSGMGAISCSAQFCKADLLTSVENSVDNVDNFLKAWNINDYL